MILNAQLDNDKAAQHYQLELLKDRILELQEEFAQLQVGRPLSSAGQHRPGELFRIRRFSRWTSLGRGHRG